MNQKIAPLILAAISAFLFSCAGSWRGDHKKSEWSLSVVEVADSLPHTQGEAVLLIKNSTAQTIRIAPGANRAWYELEVDKTLRICGTPQAIGGEDLQITFDAPNLVGDWEVWKLEGVSFWTIQMNGEKLKIKK